MVGGALLDNLAKPTQLLVARRSAPEQLAGLWEFPGGKVEAGETPEAALARELVEELGVSVELGTELKAAHAHGWPLNDRASMRVYFGQISAGQPQPLEDHDELRWMPLSAPEAILALPWIPADLPIVRALLATLGAVVGEGAGLGSHPSVANSKSGNC
ncbi:CTP pyrophosphohydrolase [Arthrobacter ulcerisalmonis]|uniref:8-oxo-dGTP diphosphatase n=1 Tax=Arthrobacter ulcerisalmonis TaxID=2483813 RepID=A0A3P5X7S1_9MICC|nr:CTP pyrophosphohydrolase [Arthrobacter ulcerisalmonis]